MKQELFMRDLQKIYDELEKRDKELGDYYSLTKGIEHLEADMVVTAFLDKLGLEKNRDALMASLNRIVGLREDSLEQVLKKSGFTKDEIIEKKEIAYLFVSEFYLKRFEDFIEWIEKESLLNDFYRELIRSVHRVGLGMTKWQNGWTSHIIYGVNRELYTLFNGDEEKIFEMLRDKKLLDMDGSCEADRCYSVLIKDGDEYKRVSYAEAFKKEVKEIEEALSISIYNLENLEDEVWFQKREWIDYLETIKRAFLHTNPDELVEYWGDVDRAWMKITTPLQIGHPLEYYEDHYRKAVALEWDFRVVNPSLQKSVKVKENIANFADKLSQKMGDIAVNIFKKNSKQIDRTQLYIGRPALFYGAEFNGLFSAQVVPNDEKVSNELGKKIFAYADFVRESKLSKPVMRLSVEVFGEEFVNSQREFLKDKESWNRVYEISTIGHEFGHILWIESDTEAKMNKSGQFKNIEEFKATSGGLMAFFHKEENTLKRAVSEELISRAVGLMAWREVGEVLPYYCEGLIHLDILYRSGVLKFNNIRVDIDMDNYSKMKELYTHEYEELTRIYIEKRDAIKFLERYAQKSGEFWLPKNQEVKEFVESYYKRYKEIGQEIYI